MRIRVEFCAAMASLLAAPAFAHHSLTMYDRSKRTTLEGTIKEFEWTNPHVWIHVIAHNGSTKADEEWLIEGPYPRILEQSGWTQTSLKKGDKAIVVMHPSKDPGNKRGLLVAVTVNGQQVWKNPFE